MPSRSIYAHCLLSFLCAVSAPAAGKVQPDSAIELLLAGNHRFAHGRPLHPDQSVARRTELAGGQSPYAVVLTCADSRVSPEIYFDQGLGDIFVLRNAGNVLDDHVIGSIEYAVEHLGASLVIVIGHAKCGAVAATVAGGHAPGHIGSIVASIQPAVDRVASEPGDKVDNAVRANAQLMAANLAQCGPILDVAVAKGRLKIIPARYDLASGKVELLAPVSAGEPAPAAQHGHEAAVHPPPATNSHGH